MYMSITITIRADEELRRELERRAGETGRSLSDVVREILRDAVTPRPMKGQIGHLAGALELPAHEAEPWRKALRERNWRP